MRRSSWSRLVTQPHLRLIALIGLLVPRRLRADWRQEWETELTHRERRLAGWRRTDARYQGELLRRSTSAFWDALWLQRKRLEDDVVQDLRYGVRMLLAQPVFTVVAVLTLALGIGANTAIFTLVDKVLIRALPVERPAELVTLVRDGTGAPIAFSYPLYVDLRDRQRDLSGLAAYFQQPFSLSDGTQTERVIGQIVSGNYFSVAGVSPALGRFFLPDEDRTPGAHPVAIISHDLFRRRFAADPGMLGRTVSLNGLAYTVVGVTPAGFVCSGRHWSRGPCATTSPQGAPRQAHHPPTPAPVRARPAGSSPRALRLSPAAVLGVRARIRRRDQAGRGRGPGWRGRSRSRSGRCRG